ncbi:MAG: GNAT family N-acetyltransferase [Anaerolineae bacterium]|jgi:ribosomal-protein-alanine N-acetyltransferase|nr:GNAT family N-acetyltransferase [Anaerolineae bacterium]
MPPIIETDYLTLRQFVPEDADTYYTQILSDPEVMKTLSTRQPVPYEMLPSIMERRLTYWEKHGFGLFAVTIKENGILIGHCGLLKMEDIDEIEVGYALGKAYWGFGLATEAAKAALRFGFEELQLNRIVAVAFQDNAASLRVMEKIGLKFEKNTFVYNADMPLYALHRKDYRPDESFYRLHK